MSTAPVYRLFSLSIGVAVAALVSGCTVGGKSFSMDSNSRAPFFGLELRERKPKSSSPNFSTISRSKTDRHRFDSAVQVGAPGSKMKMTFKRGNDQFTAYNVPDLVAKESDASPAPTGMTPKTAQDPASIAVPLDDLTSKPMPCRTVSSETIDFH